MGSTSITYNKHEEEEEEKSFLYAMQLASTCVLPMVLKSAIELDLLELIKKAGPGAYVSPAELASQLPDTTNPEAHVILDRMLRLLASYSVLNCKLVNSGNNNKVERLYGLAPVCRFLTKNEDGVTLAPYFLLHTDRVLMENWYQLKEAVVGGDNPFKKAHGMTGFEYMGADPRFGALFNVAMSNPSSILMKKVLETYGGFQGLNSLVDVGGGTGASLHMIVSRYPSIKGTNFDLPHVVRAAPSYPGVEHVGGDIFTSAIPKTDVIFLKWVAHNWNDERVLKLLKNCYQALPPEKGKVILADSISPEMPDTELSTRTVYHVDMIMLAHVHGGRERTEMEFRALAEAAGFKQFLKVCLVYDMWIMELHK